jgi:hypothetical protein
VKRRPNVPGQQIDILRAATKADLFEAAWALAALCNDAGSSDNHRATRARLLEEIELNRAARGARPLPIPTTPKRNP